MGRSDDAQVVPESPFAQHAEHLSSSAGQVELIMLLVEDLIRRDDVLQSLASAGAAYARAGDEDVQGIVEAGVFDAMRQIVADQVVLNQMREAIGKVRKSIAAPAAGA